MPETLIISTSAHEFDGDDILIERSLFPGTAVFLQVTQEGRGTGAAFLSLDEAIALNDQLVALILDAQERQR